MKYNPRRKLFTAITVILCLFTLAFTALSVSAAEDGAGITINAKSAEPPFSVVEDYSISYGRRTGDISLYKNKSKYTLFLPSASELSAVKIVYNGELQMYDEYTGNLYNPGDTAFIRMNTGEMYFYEYDASTGEYYRYTYTVMKAEMCATLYITLDNGKNALTKINSSKSNTEPGDLVMSEASGKTVYNGRLAGVSGHGNTSYDGSGNFNTKNSLNLNLENKAELVGGAGSAKKWTILRIRTNGSYDATGLSYMCAFQTYNSLIKGEYCNMGSRFVDVYINGEYRGVYVLAERPNMGGALQITNLEKETTVKSQTTKTVQGKKTDPAIAAGIRSYSYCTGASVEESTDITGGYVMEVLCGWYGDCGFLTKHGMYINVKSPEYATQEQMQYIATYVQNFENALYSDTGYNDLGMHYTDYIDATSYAAQALIYAYYLNWENYRTSTYMFKDTDGSQYGKLTFGPVWDFESGPSVMTDKTVFGLSYCYDVEQQYTWYQKAWEKGDFMSILTEMNTELESIISDMLGYTDNGLIFNFRQMQEDIRTSQEMNWIRWKQPETYAKRSESYFESLETRYTQWFGTLWNPSKYLLGITADAVKNDDGTFTLTATISGTADEDVVWYSFDGTEVGSGNSITVSAGSYYASVKGKNNAYSSNSTGKIFKNKNITMYSNTVDTSSLPVVHLNAVIEGTTTYVPDTNEPMYAEEIAAPVQETITEKKSNTIEQEAISEAHSHIEWIIITVGVVLICATVSTIELVDRKKKEGAN